MTRSVPQTTTEKPVYARDLTPNQHIVETDGHVYEIRYTLPYRSNDHDHVNLTVIRVDTGAPWQLAYRADEPVTLANPEQVAEAGAAQRREDLAAKLRGAADELRRLADDVIRHRLPVPRYLGDVVDVSVGIAESRTDLERWAAFAGASVRVGGTADRIPAFRQVRGPMTIRMQSDSEPEPVELLTPEQWQERTGVRVLDRDGWSDGKAWTDPIWYPEWLRRCAASTVQQRTAGGVLEARLPEPAPTDDEGQAAEPAGCQGCGKVGKVAAHRPGCSVVAAWDAHRAGDHSACLAGGVVCAVLAAGASGSDGDQ